MKTQLFLVAQMLLAAALMYSCFCRLLKTDMDTHREVRWAILYEGVAAGVVMGAPILPLLMPEQAQWSPWTTPYWAWLSLLVAVTLVQIVTAKYWAAGHAPAQFQKPPRWPAGAIFSILLIAVGLATSPAPASAQGPRISIKIVPQGAQGTCVAPEGCAAMGLAQLLRLMEDAEAYGRSTCAPKPGGPAT